MPKLREYQNDSGYYIRAWTEELGNITYKIEDRGWNIIDESPQLNPDENISWKYVNVLKHIGVIYTDESGTIAPEDSEFAPDPNLTYESLTDKESEKLINYIISNFDLSYSDMLKIINIVGYYNADVFNPITKTIRQKIAKLHSENRICTDHVLADGQDLGVFLFMSPPEKVIDNSTIHSTEIEDLCSTMIISLSSKQQKELGNMHIITFDSGGLKHWEFHSLRARIDWGSFDNMVLNAGTLIPIVIDHINSLGIEQTRPPSEVQLN